MPPSYMSNELILHLQELEALRQSQHAAANLLSKLPSEILQTIFHHTCSAVPPENHSTTVNNISQVCRKWREAITGLPVLWSKLQVRVCDDGSMPSPFGVSEYLNRSAHYPLTLSVIYERRTKPTNTHPALMSVNSALLASILNALFTHLHRWRSIVLHLDNIRPKMDGPVVPLLANSTSLHAPMLRSLDMTGSAWFYFSTPQVQWLNTIFKVSPKLRTFRCNGEFPLTHFDVPWRRLTRLHLLNDISLATALDILTQAKSLKECYLLRITTVDPSSSPNTPPFTYTNGIASHTSSPTNNRIIHPHLQTLALVSKVPLDEIFTTLTLPSLTSLSLNLSPRIPLKYSAFMTFLIRSACSIQSLHLQPSCMDPDELLLYLTHLSSSLKSLHLRTSDTLFYPFPSISSDIIEQLTHRRGVNSTTLCPNLETIFLERCFSSDIHHGAISHMIESRWRTQYLLPTSVISTPGSTVSRLRSASVIFPTGDNVIMATRRYGKEIEDLRRMFGEGLHGSVGFIPSGCGTGIVPYEGLLFATYPPYKMYSQAI
ncbi:hypothetical protein AX16_007043 [Volvariella volvacea WC 439]|nr:hypothetical protein AX16_007043 [Volvariella volvacea WC 439]